ncbi:MAG: hypothetical protein AUJ85_02190 [Elusimicrobia bacterium CG1_02_37_114]|nr:MAG: hypothetical protein AUJ85_02190 [Elusimicrobia bacterium CG1_02_37_114]PIV53651.1 MAG: hypothetical protein COS17_02750 [Elusimicrobia bacterium CG02_land_8_20_14_3_00_37_13]PIZ13468.1 MAG: hypothetical protein COY53_04715 [Elusimicrobia bacterium CG_4_10_14_0_8_um_filter_37_32]
MSEIAALGDYHSIATFKSQDADCYFAEGDIRQVFSEIYNKGYKIMFVTENVYSICKDLIIKEKTFPQVTIIPGIEGSKNSGRKHLSKLTSIATGTSI